MRRDPDFATHACKAGGWKCGQYRDRARWTGHLAQHCTGCGEMFLGTRAGDMHITHGSDGRPICHDPATRVKRNGDPMLAKVSRPMWDPPYAWQEFRPDLPVHPQAHERSRSTSPAALPGSPGTPEPERTSESAAVPSKAPP